MKCPSFLSSPFTGQKRRHACMACLVKNQRWRKVTKMFTTNGHKPLDETIACTCHRRCHDMITNCHTILHFVCYFKPSLSAVKAIVASNPRSAMQLDFKNQYPLHIASEYGASPDVIIHLLKQNKEAASFQDIDGKIPLHLWIKNYYYEVGRRLDATGFYLHPEPEKLYGFLRIFYQVDPESFSIRDAKGRTVRDHANQTIDDAFLVHAIDSAINLVEQLDRYMPLSHDLALADNSRKYHKLKTVPI
mmetsp:Transcript_41114/g.50044  ORF Transcript_41114/g.50044 Transcript_41114/m.50044 type:complete len:247 (+) Transcript_41114:68-808(+)